MINMPTSSSGGTTLLGPRIRNWVMPVVALVLVSAVAIALKDAFHWPLAHDAPLIHYVVFLMDHGRAPYRDIVEMNMPGAYIAEWAVMHGLGGGALGWWLWDALSGLVTIAAGAWIAGPGQRSAGIAGAALAYLFHLSDGAANFGQRDWIVATLLLVAFGFMFQSIRKRQPAWMAGFMCACGLAASIKPPAIALGLLFLVATCWVVRKRHDGGEAPWTHFAFWSLLGVLIPAGMTVAFLIHWGVTRDFSLVLHGLVPYYASLQRLSYLNLLGKAFILKPIIVGAFVVFVLGKSWRTWESSFLGAAALAGAALFLIQGKGWVYHLYPEALFAAVWAMFELNRALKASKWQQAVAVLTLLIVVLAWTPRRVQIERAMTYDSETLTHLQNDLNSLGGQQLSGQIQCLDMTFGGCINVLYRMKLVQATGFIYDFYLFPRKENAVTEALQTRFLHEITSDPPKIIVFSSHTWPGNVYNYQQLENWPSFKDVLQQHYELVQEFVPHGKENAGYRIYRLLTSPAQGAQ